MAARRDKRLEEGLEEDDIEDDDLWGRRLLGFGDELGCCGQDGELDEQPALAVCIGLAIMEQGAGEF
jgi:hypothetical protein